MREYIDIKRHKYKAFGLNLESDFIFDEMFRSDGESEVELIYGKTPDFLPYKTSGYIWYQGCKDHMLMHIRNVARYYISYGKSIVIEPLQNVRFDAVKLYLLSIAYVPLLMQRGIFPLHGSALDINNIGIIISGDPGAGKSTLALALNQKGYPLITDDISVLKESENGLSIICSYPQQRITENTASNLGIDTSLLKRVEKSNRFYLPIEEDTLTENIPLKAFFEIMPYDGEQVYLEEITGSKKLKTLIYNTYYYQLISSLEMSNEHFEFCSFLAKNINVYRIYRPRDEFTIDEQIKLLFNAIND